MRGFDILKTGALALALAGCAAQRPEPVAGPPPVFKPVTPADLASAGYLAKAEIPDSLLLNPPPPPAGSAAQARDDEAAKAALALRGTPRWDQAAIDADLFGKTMTDVFSCAAGLRIGADTTPRLQALMLRSLRDFAGSTSPTKQRYNRPRPFTVNGQPTCTPKDEAFLRTNGSYPSGHSALGYGWGLVLAEAIPSRAAGLVARGRAFGDSRRVCNVHWLSDVEEGRVVASAVFARLNADPAFLADVAAARAEVDAAAKTAAPPDCTRENAALAM